ncbi:hypothetical protein OG21DRAFT_1516698 [Imleria badia]|nr:hypothetical protein OG21DRAFT_1516698 [Imleria badia]
MNDLGFRLAFFARIQVLSRDSLKTSLYGYWHPSAASHDNSHCGLYCALLFIETCL